MKTDTYKKCKRIEEKLDYAHQFGYVTMLTDEKEIFFEAYKETFDQELSRSQKSCPRCMIQAVRRLWTEFDRFRNSPAGKKIDKDAKKENDS